MAMAHGLSAKHLQIIRDVLAPYAPQIERVSLFGSRAQGTQQDYSDIDMVLYGALSENDISRLMSLFTDSALPFSVDLKAYDLVDYAPLKAHIDRVALPLFVQADLLSSTA